MVLTRRWRRFAGPAAAQWDRFTDAKILEAKARIAATTGVYAETTSAMGLAAAQQLRDSGALSGKDRLVLVITSSGLKSAAEVSVQRTRVPVVEPTLEAMREVLTLGSHG